MSRPIQPTITPGVTAPSGAASGPACSVRGSALPRRPERLAARPTAFAVVQLCAVRAGAYSPAMWANAWRWVMSQQQLLLMSAITAMVLFTVVTVPAEIRHALSSDQLLTWSVCIVVYAALVLHRRFPLGTVAVAAVGSVVLMANGMTYPLTLPALFYALYWVAFGASQRKTLTVGVTVKAALLTASLITHPGITGFVILLWAALAVTTGSAARSHRAYVGEVEERARRAEQAREDEANRRVAEERLRIARELHDAVGHPVAL